MSLTCDEKIRRARTQLLVNQPFFGSLLMRFPFVCTDQVSTMGVDGKKVYINPEFINKLEPRHVCTVLAHEILHIALEHPLRGVGKNYSKWNIATDYATNCILKEVTNDAPDEKSKVDPEEAGGLYDSKWHGYSADQIYNNLPQQDQCKRQSGNSGSGEGWSCPNCEGQGDQLIGNDVLKPNNGKPLSEAEKAEIQNEIKIAVEQAVTNAKMQGNMPSSLQRLVDSITSPKLDWRKLLQQFLTKQSKSDYNWARVNQRHLYRGFVFPSLHTEEMGELVVGIDTSGSVGEKELAEFVSELNGILSESRPQRVYTAYCDASVASVEEWEPTDLPLNVNPQGGGGTYMKPIFDYVEENGLEPECVIIFSDGYHTVNFDGPDCSTLWIVSSAGDNNFTAPFGNVIHIDG